MMMMMVIDNMADILEMDGKSYSKHQFLLSGIWRNMARIPVPISPPPNLSRRPIRRKMAPQINNLRIYD